MKQPLYPLSRAIQGLPPCRGCLVLALTPRGLTVPTTRWAPARGQCPALGHCHSQQRPHPRVPAHPPGSPWPVTASLGACSVCPGCCMPGHRGAGATPALGVPCHQPGVLQGGDPANPMCRENIPSPGAAQPWAKHLGPLSCRWGLLSPHQCLTQPPQSQTPCSAELPGPANKKNNKDMENSIISLSSFLDLAFVNSKQTPGGAEGGNQIKPESRHGKPVFTKKTQASNPNI